MTDRTQHRWSFGSGGRAAVQAVSLAAFVYLALAVRYGWSAYLPVDLFLRFDPLLWLLSSMTAREIAVYGAYALALVAATALAGRFFCGWLCPLGAAMDAVRAAVRRKSGGRPAPHLPRVRWLVLLALIAAAIAGVSFAAWSDPLVIAWRTVHLFPEPGRAAAASAALALAAIGLGLFVPRFWCRGVCPLGAALSLAARWAPYRRRLSASCTRCGACTRSCPTGQSPERHSAAECLLCRRCAAACTRESVAFSFHTPSIVAAYRQGNDHPPEGGRRRLLFALGAAAAGLGAASVVGRRSGRAPLRPPGTGSERGFAARCVGCGACVAACPTGGLVPLLTLARLDTAFTPELIPRLGPCLPECTACSEACPTGAIAPLPAEKKFDVPIGLAVIDPARCLPWAGGRRCVVCVDACPPEYGAIELRPVQPRVFRPFVEADRCTGCGICEHRCPVEGDSAIRIVHSGQEGASP